MNSKLILSLTRCNRNYLLTRPMGARCSAPLITARWYARKTSRTRTVLEEKTYQRKDTSMSPHKERMDEDQYTSSERFGGIRADENTEISTEDSLTPDVKVFLNKVYGLLAAGVGVSATGIILGMAAPILSLPGLIGGFICMMATFFTDKAKVQRRTQFFMGAGLGMGMSISGLVAASSVGAVAGAALGTAGIFGGFTFMAMKAKNKSMLSWGGPLLGCLIGILLCSLGGLFLPMMGVTNPALLAGLHSITLYGGLVLFSLFISYDTQRMIADYKAGSQDHITPALNMFINVFQIFMRLLMIFRGE